MPGVSAVSPCNVHEADGAFSRRDTGEAEAPMGLISESDEWRVSSPEESNERCSPRPPATYRDRVERPSGAAWKRAQPASVAGPREQRPPGDHSPSFTTPV
jgi:hypothetical protein